MGQRLIITEEEKIRIQSLYESMGVAFGSEMNGLKIKKETPEEIEEASEVEEMDTDEDDEDEE